MTGNRKNSTFAARSGGEKQTSNGRQKNKKKDLVNVKKVSTFAVPKRGRPGRGRIEGRAGRNDQAEMTRERQAGSGIRSCELQARNCQLTKRLTIAMMEDIKAGTGTGKRRSS